MSTSPVVLLRHRMSACVAVEIANAGDLPNEGRRTGEPPPLRVSPFISQMATSPVVVLRHRMSALPSPLGSRRFRDCQSRLAEPGEPPPVMVKPVHQPDGDFAGRIVRHRMSACRRRLKSPTLAICQSRVGVPGVPTPAMVSPFISQMATCRSYCCAKGCRTCRCR